jgi:hypothetical protein
LETDGGHGGGEPVEALLAAKDGELVLAAAASGRYHVWSSKASGVFRSFGF